MGPPRRAAGLGLPGHRLRHAVDHRRQHQRDRTSAGRCPQVRVVPRRTRRNARSKSSCRSCRRCSAPSAIAPSSSAPPAMRGSGRHRPAVGRSRDARRRQHRPFALPPLRRRLRDGSRHAQPHAGARPRSTTSKPAARRRSKFVCARRATSSTCASSGDTAGDRAARQSSGTGFRLCVNTEMPHRAPHRAPPRRGVRSAQAPCATGAWRPYTAGGRSRSTAIGRPQLGSPHGAGRRDVRSPCCATASSAAACARSRRATTRTCRTTRWVQALRDPLRYELQHEVSLLGQPLSFADEVDLLAQLVPGGAAWCWSASRQQASFLPQVWEQLPAPSQL